MTAHVAVKYGNDTVKDLRSLAETTRSTVRGKALVNNGSRLPTLLPFFTKAFSLTVDLVVSTEDLGSLTVSFHSHTSQPHSPLSRIPS